MPSSFLPKNYKAPAGSSDYFTLQEGENRIRIISDAVIGWEGWKDNKPFRREGIEKNIEDDEVDIDQKYSKKPKVGPFWGFLVYDFEGEAVKIFTLTQKTIMKAIEGLVNDKDWGDPTAYDISIEKTVKGQRTSYSVKAYPPKKLDKDVVAAIKSTELDVQNVFRDDSEEEIQNDKKFKNF